MSLKTLEIPRAKEPKHYSNSRLSTFRECRWKYAYSYLLRLDSSEETKPPAMLFGSAGHAGLAAWYRGKSADEAIEQALAEAGPSAPLAMRTKLEEVLRGYFDYSEEFDLDWEILAVEKTIDVKLEGRTFMGIFDLVIQANNRHYIIDHKFSSNPYTAQYALDTQLSHYSLLARGNGLNPDGFIINHISPKSVEPPKRVTFQRSSENTAGYYIQLLDQCADVDAVHLGKTGIYRTPSRKCVRYCQFFDRCREDTDKIVKRT